GTGRSRPQPSSSSTPLPPSRSGRGGGATSWGEAMTGHVHTLFSHQIRVLSGRLYLAAALLIVAMMLLAAATARVRYRDELREQEAVAETYSRDLAGSTLDRIADVLHPAIKSPW